MPSRTWQPKKRKRMKTHGFRNRNSDPTKKVLTRRRAKGRTRLAVAAVSK